MVLDDHPELSLIEEERRNNEIRASMRSLKTNFIIFIALPVFAAIVRYLPEEIHLPIISALKATSPVATMAVNFGKFKQNLEELKEALKSNFNYYVGKRHFSCKVCGPKREEIGTFVS